MTLTRESIQTFLAERLGVDTSNLSVDDPLFSSGMLDSFSLVDLLMFVEKETSTRLSPVDVSLENFDSVQRILSFAGELGASRGS
jgi:acyl carrier protein